MKYTIATALAVAYAQSAFGMTINTPSSVVACQPILLSWTDGTPPYYPSVIPGGQPSAPAIKSFDTTSSTSLTWKVDVPVGSSITIALKDSTGATAYTDTVNVQGGSDKSCLDPSASVVQGSAPAASGAPIVPATTAGATTAPSAASAPPAPPPAGTAPATSARVSGTQQAAASGSGSGAPKPSSGAVRTSVTYGLTGLLAAIGVALF